jgi:2-methylcitrate dehydratase PrpD
MAKTIAREHPDMPDDSPDQFGAEVIITLTSGRQLSRRVDSLIGRGGDNPLTTQELWEKFSNCAGRTLNAARVKALFDALQSFEKIKDIRHITTLMNAA